MILTIRTNSIILRVVPHIKEQQPPYREDTSPPFSYPVIYNIKPEGLHHVSYMYPTMPLHIFYAGDKTFHVFWDTRDPPDLSRCSKFYLTDNYTMISNGDTCGITAISPFLQELTDYFTLIKERYVPLQWYLAYWILSTLPPNSTYLIVPDLVDDCTLDVRLASAAADPDTCLDFYNKTSTSVSVKIRSGETSGYDVYWYNDYTLRATVACKSGLKLVIDITVAPLSMVDISVNKLRIVG